MPGATRCHVNMAGYSSSSCIFCCFNEWGKFCQANTASGRVLKLALLCNHADAGLYLHNRSGILDRNEARDLLIQ